MILIQIRCIVIGPRPDDCESTFDYRAPAVPRPGDRVQLRAGMFDVFSALHDWSNEEGRIVVVLKYNPTGTVK